MESIGHILQEARERRGVDLAQVHSELRIAEKYLLALEDGQFGMFESRAMARGFLRSYARYLDLDPAPLLERMASEVGPNGPASLRLTVPTAERTRTSDPSGNPEGTFFNPVDVQIREENGNRLEGVLRIVLILALIVAIGLVGSRFLVNDGRSLEIDFQNAVANIINGEAEPEAGDTADLSSSADTVAAAASSANESAGATETDTGGSDVVPTSRNNPVLTAATEATGQESVATPEIPTDLEIIELRIEVLRRNWIQLSIDGELQFEGIAREGDVFEYVAERGVTLNTGSAGDLYVVLNGIDIGRLGARNQVYQAEWPTLRASQ